ncbi:MAG: preprotein translocase subunit SecE [Candidatus Omnitrophota bacterium]
MQKPVNFLKEVRQELAKVSWSNRKELFGSTAVVIAATFFCAVFIGLIDLFISKLLTLAFK